MTTNNVNYLGVNYGADQLDELQLAVRNDAISMLMEKTQYEVDGAKLTAEMTTFKAVMDTLKSLLQRV